MVKITPITGNDGIPTTVSNVIRRYDNTFTIDMTVVGILDGVVFVTEPTEPTEQTEEDMLNLLLPIPSPFFGRDSIQYSLGTDPNTGAPQWSPLVSHGKFRTEWPDWNPTSGTKYNITGADVIAPNAPNTALTIYLLHAFHHTGALSKKGSTFTVPAIPTGLEWLHTDVNQVRDLQLMWHAVEGVTEYKVLVWVGGVQVGDIQKFAYQGEQFISLNVSEYLITGDTTYTGQVIAYGADPGGNGGVVIAATSESVKISTHIYTDGSQYSTPDGVAGVIGDPYVTTLSGITYKMADFTGFSRMIQGTLENNPFTLNTETTLLTKEELTDLAIQRNKLFSEEIIEGYKVDEFPAYFSKLHASWGEDSVTIDLKTFEVIQSTINEEYETKSSMGKQYNWSTKETKEEKLFIPFGPVTLVVKNIPNPDVRNGFTILGSKHITDKVGALVKPMYVKDIKLKSLTTTKLIKDVKDRTPKKTIKQVFRTKGGEIIEKDMPIY